MPKKVLALLKVPKIVPKKVLFPKKVPKKALYKALLAVRNLYANRGEWVSEKGPKKENSKAIQELVVFFVYWKTVFGVTR